MLVGTHNKIAGYVYDNVIKKYIPYSYLNKAMFKVGNIMPDIAIRLSRLDHTREGAMDVCYEHMCNSQEQTLSFGERLANLGVSNHFLTDFFCIYHFDKTSKKRNIVKHLFYEFRIHLLLIYLLFNKKVLFNELEKIKIPNDRKSHNDTTNKLEINPTGNKNQMHTSGNMPNANTISINYTTSRTKTNTFASTCARDSKPTTDVMMNEFHYKAIVRNLSKLQKKYLVNKPGIKTDLIFAIKASMTVSEILICDATAYSKPASILRFTLALRKFSSVIALHVKLLYLQKFPLLAKTYNHY